MATKTITPAYGPANNPAGPWTPQPHTHPLGAVQGLRFGPNGRVEPVYDAEDVWANGVKIALYEAARAKAAFKQNAVPSVTIAQAVQQNDTGSEESAAEGKKQADEFLKEGKITQKEYDALTKDITPAGPGVPPGKSFDGKTITITGTAFDYGTALTPNGTTLGDMIKKVTFPRTIDQLSQGYPGMTPSQIVNNLANLALNIYEPLKKQYPKAFMTNSFRHGASIGGGQHGTGQAADFQFRGVNSNDYFDIAVWMSKNLPYDQLLLEYLPTKTVWIHCSYAIPGLPSGGLSITKNKPQNRLATLNGASGGKFTPNLHADIVANAGINRIVAA
jgi:hypothetical protein